MSGSETNILIVGVGGQGTLLASKIIGQAAIEAGYDVKVSEVHGMAQRGGSVVTYVRYSDNAIQSPIVEHGQADIILAFELLEAYRAVVYLKKDGCIIINTQRNDPMPVITGRAEYPEDIIENLERMGAKTIAFDAAETARKAGSDRAVNLAMIGKMAPLLDIPKDVWTDAIKSSVKVEFADININAFVRGYEE